MQLLSRDYDIKDICELMGVSRSGYYKWKNRKKSERDIKREELIALVDLVHADHKTHGYRWTAAFIRLEYGYKCSDNYYRLILGIIILVSLAVSNYYIQNNCVVIICALFGLLVLCLIYADTIKLLFNVSGQILKQLVSKGNK